MSIRRGIVIGAGYFSDFHLDAWRRLDGAEIVCVCDFDIEKAKAAAEKHDVPEVSTDAASCIARADIDFVDIATPPNSHQELVQAAMDRGLATICQKPLAPDFETAKQIVTIAERANAKFMVHENFRWQPWYREIKRILDAGTIGQTLHSLTMRSRMGDGWGEDAYLGRQPYFRDMPRLLMHETGVHFIDTFRFLAGEIDEVSATLRRLNPVITGEDTGLVQLSFASGAIGVWDANRYNESLSDDPRYTFGELLVEADGGSLWLGFDGGITVKRLGEEPYSHEYRHERKGFAGDCVFATQQHFLNYLNDECECETSATDYLKTLQAVEDVYLSAGEISVTPPSTPKVRSGRRVVDLSLPVDAQLPNANVTPFKSIATDGWNATTLTLYSHCGTHMDAPRHFLDDGATLEQQDLSVCCGPARVINLAPVEPSELITIERFVSAAGKVDSGERLLLRTDWHKTFGTPAYRNQLPRISRELAEWFVEQGVALIGVEPPSVADVNDMKELTDVHQTLFRGSVLIVEGLANLDQLSQTTVEFIALPLNIVGGDGCPVRAVAIET